jgi:hypothetical protein
MFYNNNNNKNKMSSRQNKGNKSTITNTIIKNTKNTKNSEINILRLSTNVNKTKKQSFNFEKGKLDDITKFIENINTKYTEDINYEEKKEIADKLSDKTYNSYYAALLLPNLPCSIRIMDLINVSSSYKIKIYSFSNERILLEEKIHNSYEELYWSSNESILIHKEEDGSYKLHILDNFIENIGNLCKFRVQLIDITEHGQKEGHAIVLLLDNSTKTFSLIDPNGISDNLNIYAEMLNKGITPYKYNQIEFPPCQRYVHSSNGTCLIWSNLFIELILRFGYENTKIYFNTLKTSELTPLIFKYGKYILNCLLDNKLFIKDPTYVMAEKICELLISSSLKIIETVQFKERKHNVYTTLQILPKIFIIFEYAKWTLLGSKNINNSNNKIYTIKSDSTDKIQFICTLIKNFPNEFDSLYKILSSLVDSDNLSSISYIDPSNKLFYLINLFFPKKGYV